MLATQQQFGVPRAKNENRPAEESVYFWHPGRFGVRFAPGAFRVRLHEIHPKLEVTWHPLKQRWLCWYRDETITYRLCPGWKLVFVVQTSWGDYVPLDERVFAVIHARSGFSSNGREYFERIAKEIERETESIQRKRESDDEAFRSEYWDYTQIKNIGSGSKFSRHQSGD